MVSVRRRKHALATESGQRRSARLMALEEQKNEKMVHAMASMDAFLHPPFDEHNSRKRGRKKNDTEEEEDYEEEFAQEADLSNNGNSLSSASAIQKQNDQIIEYILDMLELKDRKELFSMPDEFQTTDYSERVSKPGDFATLRQKHRDGMYMTSEQFETDVYVVFNKAITSNSPDSIPYREAMCLQEHAKQVFQSLRNNRTYAELELSTWHQKYFPSKRRATRNERNIISNTGSDPQSQSSSIAVIKPSDSAASNTAPDSRKQIMNCNQGVSICPQSRPTPRSSNKKESPYCSKSNTEQKRSTFKRPGPASGESTVSIAFEQPKQLAYTKVAPSYRESLLHYLSNTSPEGKMMAAKLKLLSYIKHVNTQSLPSSSTNYNFNGGFAGNSGAPSFSKNATDFPSLASMDSSSSCHGGRGAADGEVLKNLSCELQTDELLRVFSEIGKPQFLERDKAKMCQNTEQNNREKEGFTLPSKVGELQSKSAATSDPSSSRRVSLLAGIAQQQFSEQEQHKCNNPHYDLSFWKSKLNESNHEACPRSLSKSGSTSGAMGFSQYANSGSNPFKPNNPSLFSRRKDN